MPKLLGSNSKNRRMQPYDVQKMQNLILLDLPAKIYPISLQNIQLLWVPWTAVWVGLRNGLQKIPSSHIFYFPASLNCHRTGFHYIRVAPVHDLQYDHQALPMVEWKLGNVLSNMPWVHLLLSPLVHQINNRLFFAHPQVYCLRNLLRSHQILYQCFQSYIQHSMITI